MRSGRKVIIWLDVGDRPTDGPKGTIKIHRILEIAMKRAGFIKGKDYIDGNNVEYDRDYI